MFLDVMYMVYDVECLLIIRYFFNKRTKQSTWEKPVELMTFFEVSYFGSHLFMYHFVVL